VARAHEAWADAATTNNVNKDECMLSLVKRKNVQLAMNQDRRWDSSALHTKCRS
jgi:hypothetical protein